MGKTGTNKLGFWAGWGFALGVFGLVSGGLAAFLVWLGFGLVGGIRFWGFWLFWFGTGGVLWVVFALSENETLKCQDWT